MDPNANYRELIAHATDFVNRKFDLLGDAGELPMLASYEEDQAKAVEMAELILALDEWIKKGGFLPRAWDQKNRVSLVK